jgi:hypothetical protein
MTPKFLSSTPTCVLNSRYISTILCSFHPNYTPCPSMSEAKFPLAAVLVLSTVPCCSCSFTMGLCSNVITCSGHLRPF